MLKSLKIFCAGLCVVTPLIFMAFFGWHLPSPDADPQDEIEEYRKFELCYDGVVYIRAPRALTVKFNPDGRVSKC